MRLLPRPWGSIESGHIVFHGQDLVELSIEQMRKIRGRQIAMIFQEPMTALNPVQKIGKQVGEIFRLHTDFSSEQITLKSIEMLKRVGIPEPEQRLGEYSHQISGGMRQRIMIAMSLVTNPALLIADEPTTALDVTIQAQILELIQKIQKETKMTIIFITHDMGVIAQICDQVMVMYAGKIVEFGPVHTIFARPAHPYTQGLLASIPRLDAVPKSILNMIKGTVPSLYDLPEGCRFRTRCPVARPECRIEPPLINLDKHHGVSCHFIKF